MWGRNFFLSSPEFNGLLWKGLAWGEELINNMERKNLEGCREKGPSDGQSVKSLLRAADSIDGDVCVTQFMHWVGNRARLLDSS